MIPPSAKLVWDGSSWIGSWNRLIVETGLKLKFPRLRPATLPGYGTVRRDWTTTHWGEILVSATDAGEARAIIATRYRISEDVRRRRRAVSHAEQIKRGRADGRKESPSAPSAGPPCPGSGRRAPFFASREVISRTRASRQAAARYRAAAAYRYRG